MIKPRQSRLFCLCRRWLVLAIAVGLAWVGEPAIAAQPVSAWGVAVDGPLLAKRKRRKRRKKKRRKKRRRKKKTVVTKPAPKPEVKPETKVTPAKTTPPKTTTPVAAEDNTGLAVMDLKLAEGVAASVGGLLNETIISKLDAMAQFSSIISGSDMRDMIDLETQKQALGCEQDSCLAELGGALGVPYMLVSDLGRFGGQYILNIKLVAVEESKVVGRVNKILKDEAAVLGALPNALQEVVDLAFGEVVDDDAAAEPKKTVNAPVAAASPPTPAAKTSTLMRPLVWVGLGLVAVGSGTGYWSQQAVFDAQDVYTDLSETGSTLAEADSAYQTWQEANDLHHNLLPASNASMAIGAGLAAYALLFGGN